MEDYMNYSSASEDDIDYEDCEEKDPTLSENASTDGSPEKKRVIEVEPEEVYQENGTLLHV